MVPSTSVTLHILSVKENNVFRIIICGSVSVSEIRVSNNEGN